MGQNEWMNGKDIVRLSEMWLTVDSGILLVLGQKVNMLDFDQNRSLNIINMI